jgi:hypothetical protein
MENHIGSLCQICIFVWATTWTEQKPKNADLVAYPRVTSNPLSELLMESLNKTTCTDYFGDYLFYIQSKLE